MKVQFALLDTELPPPSRAHAADAGWDLRTKEYVSLAPGERRLVLTGVAVAIPMGFAGLLCPRSGLALRQGLGLVNSPGVIDAGYRGEVGVVLVNHDPLTTVELARGERIAQLVVVPVFTGDFDVVSDIAALGSSDRGSGGFGSSGR